MTPSFCTDEHVPSVFVTTLRSSGYDVVTANEVFGEATTDERLLEYCAEEEHLFVTHDEKDFGGAVGDAIATGTSRSSWTPEGDCHLGSPESADGRRQIDDRNVRFRNETRRCGYPNGPRIRSAVANVDSPDLDARTVTTECERAASTAPDRETQ